MGRDIFAVFGVGGLIGFIIAAPIMMVIVFVKLTIMVVKALFRLMKWAVAEHRQYRAFKASQQPAQPAWHQQPYFVQPTVPASPYTGYAPYPAQSQRQPAPKPHRATQAASPRQVIASQFAVRPIDLDAMGLNPQSAQQRWSQSAQPQRRQLAQRPQRRTGRRPHHRNHVRRDAFRLGVLANMIK